MVTIIKQSSVFMMESKVETKLNFLLYDHLDGWKKAGGHWVVPGVKQDKGHRKLPHELEKLKTCF